METLMAAALFIALGGMFTAMMDCFIPPCDIWRY